ncbi:Transmembrane protein [Quillaja saponaria]|uniref:Transmembrane protein n=1 Tax=Quillaja saponaria TaxID=32244 RepID=A0AAD7KPJ5_QUISA|nr:Transmembrane protein [Quillaja saponaria]
MAQLSLILEHTTTQIAIGLFISVFALVALCAKQGKKAQQNCQNHVCDLTKAAPNYKSPLSSPKKLMKKLSNKGIPFIYKKTCGDEEGGLWQRNILMGEKYQPLEFSGEIYYDNRGNQLLSPRRRSPRASPLSILSAPVAKDAN